MKKFLDIVALIGDLAAPSLVVIAGVAIMIGGSSHVGMFWLYR